MSTSLLYILDCLRMASIDTEIECCLHDESCPENPSERELVCDVALTVKSVLADALCKRKMEEDLCDESGNHSTSCTVETSTLDGTINDSNAMLVLPGSTVECQLSPTGVTGCPDDETCGQKPRSGLQVLGAEYGPDNVGADSALTNVNSICAHELTVEHVNSNDMCSDSNIELGDPLINQPTQCIATSDIIVPFSAPETIVAEPSAPEFIDAYVSKSGTVGVEVPQSVCEHASQNDPAVANMSEALYMSARSVNNGPPHTASTVDTDAQVLEKSQTRVPEPDLECVMTASNYVPPAVILTEPIKMPEAACEMDYENVSEVTVATMENTTAEDLQIPSPTAIS